MKWSKRSVIVYSLVTLGVTGISVFLIAGMRPAFQADTAADASPTDQQSLNLSEPDAGKTDLDVTFSIDPSAPQGITRYHHRNGEDAFALLQPAGWTLRFHTKDGKLLIENNAPVLHATSAFSQVKADYAAYVDYSRSEKQPDNSFHNTYKVNILCHVVVTSSFWGEAAESVMFQSFRVDVAGGTVDPETPLVPPGVLPPGVDTQLATKLPVEGLPGKCSGTPADRALQTILYRFGSINSSISARKAAKELPALMKEAIAKQADPDRPWPGCWGDADATARSCARAIVPTLLFLQERECYNCQELVELINGPDFTRCFGEKFADKVQDPLDEPIGDFPIEQVSEEQITADDEEEAKQEPPAQAE